MTKATYVLSKKGLAMDSESFLAHYGVKGMKWGVRRDLKKKAKRADKIGKQQARLDRPRLTNSGKLVTAGAAFAAFQVFGRTGSLVITAVSTGAAAAGAASILRNGNRFTKESISEAASSV